jgi:quinol monooxygenase YgiN
MSQITWVITLEAKEGKIDALKGLVTRIKSEVSETEGNLLIKVVQHNDIKTRFTLFEQWDDKSSHEKYLQRVAQNGILEEASQILAKPFQGSYHTEL